MENGMASRLLHLAAAECILQELPIGDENRFRFGSVIPDAGERVSAHFRISVDNGARRTMALTLFRERFAGHMDDPLYLGYYLHLVQDIVLRKIFYLDRGWHPDSPEKIARLYADYRILNAWAIEKFSLRTEPTAPEHFAAELLFAVSEFRTEEFLATLHEDFQTPPPPGECMYFTKPIAEEFLRAAVPLCQREAAALRTGGSIVNEYALSWRAE